MNIIADASLAGYNTLSLEASARALLQVDSTEQLHAALAWADQQQLPVVPLGEGSNVVFATDLEALVVVQNCRGIELLDRGRESVLLRVAAGENWHELVSWSLANQYYGLQNLAYIPGKVGAAPIQNIGAYGVEFESVIERVHGLLLDSGEPLELDREACQFGYRDSVFKGDLRDQAIITAIDLRLSLEPAVDISYPALAAQFTDLNPSPTPQQVFDTVVAIRSSKLPDPALIANAGSFFKNPELNQAEASELASRFPGMPRFPQASGRVKIPAGWMIDHLGWKGFQRDGLGVHPEHALVLVNYGNNTGAALLALADEIAEQVRDTFGIELVIEPRVYR